MKTLFKRMNAGLLVLMILISLLTVSISAAEITTTPTGYTKASDVVYKTGNKGWIYNWGARGEDCVFLSKYASAFYTGSNTFDSLSKLAGGTSQSNAPQSALYSALSQLMKSNHSYQNNYDASKQMFAYTDCVSNNTSQLSSFYSGKMVGSSWSSGGSTWNREHTWPNSKGMNGNDEHDIMMLRPTIPTENGSRGNTAYGESGSYFDPGTSNRGDVARIVLYVYVRWGNTSRMWGSGGVIENLDILLKWMAADPVDTWEMGRNDAVQSITGTRNVFVDYPELAWLLFGRDVPSGITTPSDNDGVSANPGGNGGSTTPTPDTSYTQISTLKDGDKVVIVNPASKMALSTQKTGFYNIGVDVSGGFGDIANSEIFTAKKNSDGSWSFTSADGKKLAMGTEYSSLNETGTNDKWTLSSAGGNQFYLLNTGRDLYLEWYASKNNWSAYKPDSLSADYALAFYVKSGSGSNPQPTTPATQPTTPATQPTTPPTQPTTPATQPTTPTQPTIPTAKPTTPANKPTTPVADSPAIEYHPAESSDSSVLGNLLTGGDIGNLLTGGNIGILVIALAILLVVAAIAAVIVIIVVIIKKRKKSN